MIYDTIIIGAGVFGCSIAYSLSKKGQKVVVIDQFSLKNNFNSSYDKTRILKFAHGGDLLKTEMIVSSLKLYRELERISGKQLFFPIPAFFFGKTDESFEKNSNSKLSQIIKENYVGNDANDHHIATVNLLNKLNFSSRLILEQEIKDLYPQFISKFGMLDENSGILEASAVVDTLINLIKRQEVRILENTKVVNLHRKYVELENGKTIKGKNIVVSCGAFAKKLIGDKSRILPIKKEIIYLEPKNPQIFQKKKFPIFLDINSGFYGLPIHKGSGVKIGNHFIGKEVDPYNVDRSVSKEFIELTRSFLKNHIPDLYDSEIVKTKVCLYEMPPDEEFILDRLSSNLFLVAGAGQGFKFAPLFGELISELILGEKLSFDISRFSLRRFRK